MKTLLNCARTEVDAKTSCTSAQSGHASGSWRQRPIFPLLLLIVSLSLQNLESRAQSIEKSPQNGPVPALNNLKEAFRSAYDEAITNHGTKLSANFPVITQDLLNMTLIRPNGTKLRYSMDKRIYFLMAHSSHPPLTIYSILSRDGFDR